jgi:hypothetical protein
MEAAKAFSRVPWSRSFIINAISGKKNVDELGKANAE